MKFSLSWLKEYVTIDTEVSDLADALTMAGLEVDSVTDRYGYLDTVITGRVVSIKPHPDADRLQLCDVDIGERTISIVCGATNVKEGGVYPCALPGTLFPDGRTLEKGVIRGIESKGMLCSEFELGLDGDQSGIMPLEDSTAPGIPIAKVLELSDTVVEIDLTPNRSDCLSLIGIAREVAAIQNKIVKYPEVFDDLDSNTGKHISDISSVTIEVPDLCPRYAAKILYNIKVGPSPQWLKDCLLSIGLRPINNIVDITNFVMMESGQPLHAFDLEQLAENRIIVRTAKQGETFVTLDNKERKLTPDMLMICDGKKPVALAGVMGGLNSEIEDTTTTVFIESAYFNPVCIRKTAKKLSLNTDSSHRFERGVDPEGTVNAMNRAAWLMMDLAGGKAVSGTIDERPKIIPQKTIPLSIKDTNRLLGTNFALDDIKKYLESIEFPAAKKDDDTLDIAVPTYRVDISRPQDLMEEIARLSGYNHIPVTFPSIPAVVAAPAVRLEARTAIKKRMAGFGFSEVINYSFISPLSCDRLTLPENDKRRNLVEILNPLTEDQAVMRTSLVPGLLENIRRNISVQEKSLRLFEIGNTFLGKGKENQPQEVEMLAGIWTGFRTPGAWHTKENACDFYDIKGAVEALFQTLDIHDAEFTSMAPEMCSYTTPGCTASIFINGQEAGLAGKISPQVLGNYDLKQDVFIFEINMEILTPLMQDIRMAKPIPKYPATSRDITLIINKDVEAGNILKKVETAGEDLVESIYLFDIYEGDPIPEGEKSISIRIVYRSSDKTLEDDQINRIHKANTEKLVKELNATLP